ncbi:acyl carrier protein [Actinocorallia longicatena]|uniref:Carrier domain-containing protein n=1 Tax=Actinocorallia longicatena TaxID=111803 RepID=A0ABP6QFI2_9ACTN
MIVTTRWLRETAAGLLGLPADELDPARPLAELGFSSRTAVVFTGLIADRFDTAVTPTLLWEFPTMNGLAAHLTAGAPAPAPPRAPHPLTDLLSESS